MGQNGKVVPLRTTHRIGDIPLIQPYFSQFFPAFLASDGRFLFSNFGNVSGFYHRSPASKTQNSTQLHKGELYTTVDPAHFCYERINGHI